MLVLNRLSKELFVMYFYCVQIRRQHQIDGKRYKRDTLGALSRWNELAFQHLDFPAPFRTKVLGKLRMRPMSQRSTGSFDTGT